jgi:FecR protein
MKSMRVSGLAAAVLSFAALEGRAQPARPAKSGLSLRIEGKVYVDGQSVDQSRSQPTEIRENSLLSTGEGRAELILGPGVTLRLSENSSLRTVSNATGAPRIEILTGSAFIVADGIPKDSRITVVCEDAVTLSNPGAYRFDANPTWASPDKVCRLKTYKGAADVRLATVNVLVKSGETINLSRACQDMIPTNEFDINDADRLDESTHYFRFGWIVGNRRR